MVKGCGGLSFEERLEMLKLFSFTRRRLRGDLIPAYNISNGDNDVCTILEQVISEEGTNRFKDILMDTIGYNLDTKTADI